MFLRASSLFLVAAAYMGAVHATPSMANYANDFVDPNYILSKNYPDTTIYARNTIQEWADESASHGPWSVTSKQFTAPSGDKHDYMSWAPYAWPDCSNAGNTTQLSQEQIWVQCEYVTRDGQFNPDHDLVMDADNFDSLANAVFFNSIAWGINGSSTYSSRVATFIQTWFLNADTYMNPNLNYAQMQRGPDGQNGTHTGVLDLKCTAKIASGVLTLRAGKAPEWTADMDAQFVTWLKKYKDWLTSSPLALKEKAATNNHGSFYYNQLAAIEILIDDKASAQTTLEEYFDGIFKQQIAANGDQPLESGRTRPAHYRAYNLAAMITNARLGQYTGFSTWNRTSTAGATIENALRFATTAPLGSGDTDSSKELYPIIAAVASVYGDPQDSEAKYVNSKTNGNYITEGYFFWDQPFSDSGNVAAKNHTGSTKTSHAPPATVSVKAPHSQTSAPVETQALNGARASAMVTYAWQYAVFGSVAAAIFA